MNVKDEATAVQKKQASMCTKCHQFWGSEANEGMCSKCYNSVHKKKAVKTEDSKHKKQEEKKQQQKKDMKGKTKGEQQNKNRCFDCKKKVGLLGIECKCGYIYCNVHRLPEDHACDFNHEEEGKDKLKKQIIKISHQKITEV